MDILQKNIKDVIKEFPAVGDILFARGIGCTTCNVGTCLLKDIIEIHALSLSAERELFDQIAEIVYPGQNVHIPALPRKAASAMRKKFSPPMQMLVDEHTHIKRVIAAINDIVKKVEDEAQDVNDTIGKVIDFIRNYADRFHHAKEEDILFKLFDETTDIIATMYKEHDIGRALVKAVLAGLAANDTKAIVTNLTGYAVLLTQHITKEDDILYPWMDRNLSDSQVGALYARFLDVADTFGEGPKIYETFADSLTLN